MTENKPEKTLDEYMAEAEARELKHTALQASLEIPADEDGQGDFEDRMLQAQWVQSRHADGDYFSITGTSGWTAGCSEEVYNLLPEGKAYILETIRASRITGWIIDGKWYDRKSDQDLKREHEEWKANWEREKRENLEQNREAWTAREAALPDWVRVRLETFHEKGGEKFELEGWGYELMIAELAVEYFALGDVIRDKDVFGVGPFESEAIKTIASEQGTTGNQHSMALAIAKVHLNDPEVSMDGTVSALSPIDGDPFYEKS